MRDIPRRVRVLAAAGVVALSLVAPGAATVRRTLEDGGRGRSVLIRVIEEPAEADATPDAGHPKESIVEVDDPKMVAAEARTAPSKPPTHAAPVEAARTSEDLGPGVRTVHNDIFGDPPAVEGSGECAKATTCRSYQLRPARWKTDEAGRAVIKWRFNDEGRRNLRAPAGLLESAVRSSMSEWSRWDSNVVFAYDGLTTATFGATGEDGSCDDGVNTVTWAQFDPAIIAAASMCLDDSGRILRDADLAMNVTQHWEDIRGEPESRHTFDIRSIVTHELGHWLGLLDLYSPDDVTQTMSGFSEYGEVRKRTPALGDVLGVQEAYPCDAADACPRKGFADD